MARGNDSQAALVDLRGEFGAASGNAQDLIDAQRSALSQGLRTALNVSKDNEHTIKLLEDQGLDGIESKFDLPADAEIIDAAVRGPYVVAVVEVKSGRTYKDFVPYSEFGGPGPRGSLRKLVEENEIQKADREAIEGRMRDQADAAQAQRDAEAAAQAAAEKARASRAAQRGDKADK